MIEQSFLKKASKTAKFYSIDNEQLINVMKRDFKKGIITRRDMETLWVCTDDCVWLEMNELRFGNYVYRKARAHGDGNIVNKVQTRTVSEAHKILRSLTLDPYALDLGGGGIFDECERKFSHIVACRNRFIDVMGKKFLIPDPKFHRTRLIPLWIDDNEEFSANCPKFKEVLWNVFNGDESLIQLLQEIFGYCFLGDNRYAKLFVFYGDGGTGKSSVLKVLQMVLNGSLHYFPNTSSVGIEQLAKDFSLFALIGKMANISDENPKFLGDSAQIVKAISSGDTVTINPKHKQMYSARMNTKLIFSSNEKPNFNEINNAIGRRLVILPFEHVFSGTKQENVRIVEDILFDEVKGILFWALEGLDRLMANNQFTQSTAANAAYNDMLTENDPVKQFFDDCLKIVNSESARLSYTDIKFKWNKWVMDNDVRKVPTWRNVMKRLRTYSHKESQIIVNRFSGHDNKSKGLTHIQFSGGI